MHEGFCSGRLGFLSLVSLTLFWIVLRYADEDVHFTSLAFHIGYMQYAYRW